ncbi:MAG: right-handed parallel beta-helix repeat-containing protein [Candidatus Eisenbacteria sp.]|nr:right-handed parallel beta-helix repeat-containing protein [Candidatus Eisenbacteria bacterium]
MTRKLLAVLLVLSAPWAACATTYLVLPDGSGNLPTIQAAVDAAVTGDTIHLADGTFSGEGNYDILCEGKAITIRSQGDAPSICIIDCQGTSSLNRRGFEFKGIASPGAVLRGITVTNGHGDMGGGAVCCWSSAIVAFSNCVFSDSRDESGSAGGGFGGGGVVSGGGITFTDCRFEGNSATGGGAFAASGEGTVSFERCTFVGNNASLGGGACDFDEGIEAHLTECTFLENSSPDGGALRCWVNASVSLYRCTLVRNTATGAGSCFLGFAGGSAVLDNSILAFGEDTPPVHCDDPDCAQLSCCDVYGNAGGDWVDGIEGLEGIDGNMSMDPLFCGSSQGDYALHSDSPCAAENNAECGQIGALGIGCAGSPVEDRTWGGVKALFQEGAD